MFFILVINPWQAASGIIPADRDVSNDKFEPKHHSLHGKSVKELKAVFQTSAVVRVAHPSNKKIPQRNEKGDRLSTCRNNCKITKGKSIHRLQ